RPFVALTAIGNRSIVVLYVNTSVSHVEHFVLVALTKELAVFTGPTPYLAGLNPNSHPNTPSNGVTRTHVPGLSLYHLLTRPSTIWPSSTQTTRLHASIVLPKLSQSGL